MSTGGMPAADVSEAATSTSRRNSGLIAAGILLSRLAGFARQRAIAHYLGVGPLTDAFTAALKIPNLLQNLLGEGVLSASFIPTYSRLLAEGRDQEAGRVAGAVAGLLTVVAGTLVLLGVVFAAPLTRLIAPGYTGDVYELTVTLMRILTPGIGFLVLSAWCLGVLNSHRRFFLSYVAPVLWNAAQIAALVGLALMGLADRDLVVALAWGAFAGAMLQFLSQLPGVIRVSRDLRLSLDTQLDGVRRTVRAFAPVVAGRGVVQLLNFVELALASLLAYGAVAALGYAQMLFILPISLFGMSVAAAELPELSGANLGDRPALARRMDASLARIAFYVVPSAVAFLLIGDLLVALLYGTGEFGPEAITLVWLTLAALSIGLVSNTSSRLLQSALYASGDPVTPAKVAVLRVVVAATAGAALMLQFDRIAITEGGLVLAGQLPALGPLSPALREQLRVAGELRLGVVGLALAAGSSSWLEFALLRRAVKARLGHATRAGGGRLLRTVTAAALAGAAAVGTRPLLADLPVLLATLLACLVLGLAYVAGARMLGLDEVSMVLRRRR